MDQLKFKPIKPKKPKYSKMKFQLDISKPIAKDTDGDKVPDYLDCNPTNPKEKGLLHLRFKAKRIQKKLNKGRFTDNAHKEDLIDELMRLDAEIMKAENIRQEFIQREGNAGVDNSKAGVLKVQENLQRTGKQININFNKFAKQKGKKSKNFIKQTRQPRYLNEAPKFRHGVYLELKNKALERKEKILRENREDRKLPYYTPETTGYIFKPPTHQTPYVSNQSFKPHQAPLPPYLDAKRQAQKIQKVIEHLIKIGRQDKIPEFQKYINEGGRA